MVVSMLSFYASRRVLITGAAGTVGQQAVRELLRLGAAEIRCLDNNEEQVFLMDVAYASEPRYRSYVCDVKDKQHLTTLMDGVSLVIHAAALKHVPSCERSPQAAVSTNILGVQNVIDAAVSAGVDKVVFTSSDKAVNPTNVMGTTKLMGERLTTAANIVRGERRGPVFISTRFGNVAGSSGSVIPVFMAQIKNGRPITLTHPNMTRFMMNLDASVRLVLESLAIGKGAEVFITKMPVIRIETLARRMIALYAPRFGRDPNDVEVQIIGARPGEKLYEELMTEEELARAVEMDDLFVVLPAQKGLYDSRIYEKYSGYPRPTRAYVSQVEPEASDDVTDKIIEEALSGLEI